MSSDFDEHGRRVPDYDELAETHWLKQRRTYHCLCGYPDWPGQCPGPHACPVHGQDLKTYDD